MMAHAFALVAMLLLAPAPPTNPRNLRAPALEAVVQDLRPVDDDFVRHPPIELDLQTSIDLYQRLWRLGRAGLRAAGRDRALAQDFRVIAEKSRVAFYAGLTAQPYFRVARRSDPPIMLPELERRTERMVATVVARGEEVRRAISRVLARFPLWTDDSAWGYRPPPTHEPPPRGLR